MISPGYQQPQISPAPILIIGIGNEYRGDDGIGPAIARRLRERHLSAVTILEISGDLMDIWEKCQGAETVILVDAAASGGKPGTLYRFEAHREPLPQKLFAPSSTHALGLAAAVELARALKLLPATLIVYGLEGKSFASGQGLSPEVQQALPGLMEEILQDLKEKCRATLGPRGT
ncbi:MAG: hydrogenase maturation protease [Thermodesulfobacteriota bacterium]